MEKKYTGTIAFRFRQVLLYYIIMGPPSYVRSVVDQKLIMRRMTVYCGNVGKFILLPVMFANLCFFINRTDCLIPPLTVKKCWRTHQRTVSCPQAGQYHLSVSAVLCIRLESSHRDWSHILRAPYTLS